MKSTKIAKLLILAMAAILLLTLVACDSDDVDTEIPSDSSTESFEETDPQPEESENTDSETVESSAQSDTADSNAENTEDSSETEGSEAPKFSYFEEDMFEYLSFERSDYIGIEAVISTDFRIDSDDVQAYINNKLMENRIALNYGATMTDKPIELIDSAFIYYTGYVDGVAFSGGSNMSDASPYELIIGSGAFIPGFEEALIGLIPAETSKESPAQITVTFPENYGNDLAGKEAVFDIWIVYSIQYDLPEYNESFITDVLKFEAKGDDVIAEYEASVVKTLEEQLAEKKTAAVDEAMWEVLFDRFTVLKYPEDQVKSTYDYYIEDFEYNRTMYGYYGYSFETLGDFAIWYMGLEEGADWEAALLEESRRNVCQYMIYHGIAQAEGFTVTDEEYAAQLEYYIEYYKNYGYSDEELEAALGKEYIKESALFNEVYELLTANITVSYEE